MEIISHDDKHISFILKGVNMGIANSLRRIIMSEIPILSVDVVQFYRNDSLLDDEFISHRLGMVVLDSNDIKNNNEKTVLNLNVTCNDYEPMDVTVGMIKSDVQCLYPDTILTRLYQGQSLHFSAIAKIGTGGKHAKWSPVCGIGMEPVETGIKMEFETTGALPPKEIVKIGMKLLDEKISKIQAAL